MPEGRVSKGYKNIITGIIGKLLGSVTVFAVRTVFIHTLGSTYLGLNGLFSNILSLLNIAELGLSSAIVFELYSTVANGDNEKSKAYLNFFKNVYRIIGLIILAGGLAFMPFLSIIVKEDVPGVNIYLIFFLSLLGTCSTYWMFSYRNAIVSANQDSYRFSVLPYANSIISAVIQIVFLLVFKEIYLYLITPIVMSTLLNLFQGMHIGSKYPYIKEPLSTKLNKDEVSNIKKNVFALLLYKISSTIGQSTDSIFLSTYIGLKTVGIYSNYAMIITQVRMFLAIIFESMTSGIGNLNASSDKEKKHSIFKMLNFANFWFFGFCAVCFLVLFKPFILLWIGEEYVLNGLDEFTVVLNFITYGLHQTVLTHRTAAGLFYKGRYRPVFSLVINISVSLILLTFLAPHGYGISGIMLGSVIASFSTTWWFDAWLVHKNVFGESPFKYYITYWLRMIFILALSYGLKYICSFYNFSPFLNVLIALITCIVVVNGLFVILFHKTEEFKYIVNSFLQMFLSRFKKTKQHN